MQVYAIQEIGTGYLLYGTQPRITTYEDAVTARQDSSNVLGYELGYALGAWLNKREAAKQIDWIDKDLFHAKTLAPNGNEMGVLIFYDVTLSEPPETKTKGDWVDQILAEKSVPPDPDRSIKLVIFVEDQQFVLRFGPEVVER
jgi:hypothetical protein